MKKGGVLSLHSMIWFSIKFVVLSPTSTEAKHKNRKYNIGLIFLTTIWEILIPLLLSIPYDEAGIHNLVGVIKHPATHLATL